MGGCSVSIQVVYGCEWGAKPLPGDDHCQVMTIAGGRPLLGDEDHCRPATIVNRQPLPTDKKMLLMRLKNEIFTDHQVDMNRQVLSDSILKLSPLSDDDLSALVSVASYKEFPKGATVLKEGEVCRLLYFVEEGYLRTYYNKDGVTINLNFTLEGDFTIDLKSAKSQQPSELTIEAGEDVRLWVFEVDKFETNFSKVQEVERFLRKLFVRLLLVSEEYSNLYKISTPAERYKYVEQNKPILLQRISLSQMASYIGVSRETLSRIRGKNNDNRL